MRPNTTFDAANHTAELIATAERYVREAAASGADVALMPELWSVGYEAQYPCESGPGQHGRTVCARTGDLLRWMGLATPLHGGYIEHFTRLAKELDIAIGATYMEEVLGPGGERWPPRNSVAMIGEDNRL